MSSIQDIKAPVTKDLAVFQKHFKGAVRTQIPLLNAVNAYVFRKKGKQLRPILVLLSARLCGGVSQKSLTAATLVELFHTASLVHDDVVDNAKLRRGIFSINAIWKSKVAVLVGDFLLSKSMLVALEAKEFGLLEIISNAVKEISEGELLQLDKAQRLKNDEETYLKIITKKTAALFAACTKAGAASATDNAKMQEQLYLFGLNLGIAFQMQDDLLDFDKKNVLGKPLYNDLREQKMTLPLIYALQQRAERKTYFKLFKKKRKTQKDLELLAAFIKGNGGVDYTQEKMRAYRDKAISYLADFEDCAAKKALLDLAAFTTTRNK